MHLLSQLSSVNMFLFGESGALLKSRVRLSTQF